MSRFESKTRGWPRNRSTGPQGGLSTGPGGGMSTGPTPYFSNIPPRGVFLEYLRTHGYESEYRVLKDAWRL